MALDWLSNEPRRGLALAVDLWVDFALASLLSPASERLRFRILRF